MRTARILAAALALLVMSAGAADASEIKVSKAAKWPERELIVTLDGRQQIVSDDVRVRENGDLVDFTVRSAASDSRRGVVLAIDASRSMRGEPIQQALVAARELAANRGSSTPLGIVFFSGEPRTELAPTQDGAAIESALAVGPPLQGGTNIYDGAAAAVASLQDAGMRAGTVIVMSDGADTGSRTEPAALADTADEAGVRIFTVGLRSERFTPTALEEIASANGGTYVEAARAGDLPQLFSAIGEQLAAEHLITYKSTVAAGADVLVEARVLGEVVKTDYAAPKLAAGPEGTGGSPSNGLDPLALALIALACFLMIGLVLYLLLLSRQRSVADRVSDFAGVAPAAPAATPVRERRRSKREPSELYRRYATAIELSGVDVPAAALALGTAIATVLAAWLLVERAGHVALALLALGVPLAVRLWVVTRLSRRRLKFEEQLPDNLQLLVSALRTGHSFSSALAGVAADAREPSRAEFRRASADEQLGVDVADALRGVGERMKSAEIEYVGIVARMQRETGGNTAEILEHVIETVRDRQHLRRTVRTLTAQSRAGAAVITALPIIIGIAMTLLRPEYFDPMLESSAGIGLLLAGAAMLTAGWLTIRKIVDMEA